MKKALVLVATLICNILSAQETTKTEHERQHAIEITTGYPSILFDLEFPWINTQMEYSSDGLRIKEYFQPGLNIGYTYSWRKRWEVNALANLHLTVYDIMQYPYEEPLPSYSSLYQEPKYDFDAEPTLALRSTSLFGSLSASVRFKWIVRESFSMYSALGAGISIGFPIPFPYIAPVGIKFGKGKVYGIAELNMTPATSIAMAGIGVRL